MNINPYLEQQKEEHLPNKKKMINMSKENWPFSLKALQLFLIPDINHELNVESKIRLIHKFTVLQV